MLLAQMPLVAVPTETSIERLDKNGQRLLLAGNGVFIEVRRDWLYAIRRCGGLHPDLQTPFGAVHEVTELAGKRIPRTLIDAFVEQAKAASPQEIGAIITYDLVRETWALRMSRSLSASEVALSYEIPDLAASEYRVVDIHSHGEGPAFLSSTDRKDTLGATAVVMVAGKVSEPRADIIVYLYLQGMPVRIPWSESGDIAADSTEMPDE
jgi:PRTRC genetic system protein A